MTLRQPRKGDWTGGKEDGWRSGQKGTANEREGQRGCAMSSLNRWVASPRVEGNYILCVTPTGAAATATQ